MTTDRITTDRKNKQGEGGPAGFPGAPAADSREVLLPAIDEVIVVEGRDDTAAIRQAVDAVTIETHGFGIREETWKLIGKAYENKGIIIFTDPDAAGERIRRRILERFPEAAEAFLDRALAEKDGDIGIENASPKAIRDALAKAHRSIRPEGMQLPQQAADPKRMTDSPATDTGADRENKEESNAIPMSDPAPFTVEDLFRWKLDGVPGAAARRRKLGQDLGIGYATAKTFLRRLNRFGIAREEIEAALGK